MAIPFSNTTQRIPPGFANLLEGLAREVLRSQPEDIPTFAAKYFETLLIEREKTGYDPSEWGAKLDDRYYNNRAFNELAPPGGGDKSEEKGEEPAAEAEESVKKAETKGSGINLTEEQAAIKIQATFRGYKTRKEMESSKEEPKEGKEEEKEEGKEPEKEAGTEAGTETRKEEETSKPDQKEPQ
ncbi:sperm surface protein Sp17 [Sceloporus undulatus]|uniref:sperm surface protein Sp17 n=1 Tax=Sceloporus undulatus TaxID=8520 RepID=UPI001C4B22B9|nr:sperm surface protein Sp17 [Sceloporus undulatus]XP_042331011.1 sperm surface protein Sp17 [Sceloporus undulatus]